MEGCDCVWNDVEEAYGVCEWLRRWSEVGVMKRKEVLGCLRKGIKCQMWIMIVGEMEGFLDMGEDSVRGFWSYWGVG